MDMMTMFIMGAVLYGTMIPMYFFAANLRLPKKNIILGVTVPYAHHAEQAVEAVSARYLKRIRIMTVISLILGLPIFFVAISIQTFILLTVLLIYIAGDMVIFVGANRALKAVKRESNWAESAHTVPAVADFRAMEEKNRPISRLVFLLPCLVAAVPLVFIVPEIIQGTIEWGQVIGYGVIVATLPLIFVLGEAIRRQNAEIVGTNSDFNVILTRIRRREHLRCMALIAWMLALIALVIWFQTAVSEFLFIGVIVILTIVVMVYAFRAEFAVRRAQERFTKLVGDTLAVDDDEYWLWGLIYYNKDDKRLIIKDRIGINMSVNMGRPIGLILMLASALVLLAMPLIGVWVMAQEFSPIRYELEGNTVIVRHVTTRQFDLGEHFEVEFLDTLPSGTRTNGTAVGTLQSGHFNFRDIGSAWVLLHADQPPFILLTTEGGQRLIFNDDPVFAPLYAVATR